MRIQPVMSQYVSKNKANGNSVKSQKIAQSSNINFAGDYARVFKKSLTATIRSHSDSCDILKELMKALKTESVVMSQAYRRFSNYYPGEFVSIAAKEPDTIIAEPVRMSYKPFVEIRDGEVVFHDMESSDSLTYYYHDGRFNFSRSRSLGSDSVKNEHYLYWPNGNIETKTTSSIWNGGSDSETEYFDRKGNRSNFWKNLFE